MVEETHDAIPRRRTGTASARFPKQGTRIRTQRDADKALDKAENAKVPIRSGGRCEVKERRILFDGYPADIRCQCAAQHIMHLIGGRGKRGRGISALAKHKLHGCARHHREIDGDIGGKKLKRIGGPIPHYTDCYERIR